VQAAAPGQLCCLSAFAAGASGEPLMHDLTLMREHTHQQQANSEATLAQGAK